MNHHQFEAACRLLFGPSWKAPARAFLNASARNVAYWASPTGYPAPDGVADELRAEIARRASDQTDEVWVRYVAELTIGKHMRDMMAHGMIEGGT